MGSSYGRIFSDTPITLFIVVLALLVIAIIGMWKTFEKAGKPGWACIIPIYSSIVLAEIAKKPTWMGVVAALGGFVPVVGFVISLVFSVILGIGVAEGFKKSQGFGVGLGLLGFIFYAILGFGDDTYNGTPKESLSNDILDAI